MEAEVSEGIECGLDDDPPEEVDLSDGGYGSSELNNGSEVFDEDAEMREDGPLANDVVLASLMNYVNTVDLQNSRLVCKLWAAEAWRQLTRRKCISFNESSMTQFSQFMEIVQVDNIHFSKLHFCHFTVKKYKEELKEYFESAGIFVKELRLQFVDKELTLEELEDIFLSNVPNLKFLSLDRLPCDFFSSDVKFTRKHILKNLTHLKLNTRCHYNNDEEKSTVFFTELLGLTPNLKHLHGAVDWCVPRLVMALSNLKLPFLSGLILKGCIDCQTARTLALPQFHLETLYLGTSGFYDLGIRNHNIVYSKRHTLRALGLGWASFMKRIDLETVSEDYNELACLSLCDSSKWSLCGSPYSGPGLKRLLADIRKESDFLFLEGRPEAFKDIRELNLSFMTYQVRNLEIVNRISNLFPAVKLLTLKITHEFPISNLWPHFVGVEELSLYINCKSFKVRINPNWTPYLDDVMTGIDERDCEILRSDPALLETFECPPNSSLLNLKNLRKFTFAGGDQKLTHVTAQLCISNLKRLTAVSMQPVTETCKEYLQKSLPPGTYVDVRV